MNTWIGFAFALLVASGCNSARQTEPDPQPQEAIVSTAPALAPLSEDVEFEAAGMKLYGTITRPAGDGKFPAIAIAAGSGPTDRDWLNPLIPGPNGSAKQLAEALAADGVVLLRYDKRGTGKTGMPASGAVAWGDYVAELSAAAQVLSTRDYVDPDHIYVAGHSEGGVHALRVAANPPVPLAGIILLSTAGRSLRDIVIWQISSQIRASGLNPDAAQAEIDALTSAVDDIAAGKTVDVQKVGQLPGVQQFLLALQNPQSVGFARELLKFDPLAAFSKFQIPVLIVSGAHDIQVDPELDAKPLAEAAKAAGRPTRLVVVEDADHVLKTEPTPRDQLTPAAAMQYNAEGRKLSPAVEDAIVQFVTGGF